MDSLKNIFGKTKDVLFKVLSFLNTRPVLFIVALGNVINLIVEIFCRRSITDGFAYLFTHPFLFEYNALIIMLTLSVAFLMPRRLFSVSLISLIWIGLAFANFVLLGFRTTPLAAIDFSLLVSALSIINIYLTPFQIVLVAIGIVALCVLFVLLWKKAQKYKVGYVKALSTVAVTGVCLILTTSFSLESNALSTSFGNLADAYKSYGFAYCFSTSVVDRGIDEPDNYSQHTIEQIMNEIGSDKDLTPDLKPNVIMVQLESFFDVNYMKNYSFSQNPVPVFSTLKNSCPSGFLTVPSIGAGTANTEFEVISGMSLDYFGTGEYPYKTILQTTPCETINYNLKELGYTTHAIHNHTGSFYDRNNVYKNLGFDTFTSLEYMSNPSYNALGWAEDKILVGPILDALSSTENQDFVYAISVQAHGKYPDTVIDESQTITMSGAEDEIFKNRFEYFINQLNKTDAFIGSLIDCLSDYDEPVVVVFFGDHLPSFEITADELENGDLFQTEYVIWNNFGLSAGNKDVYAFQLNAYIMDLLGFDNGVLTKLHQRYSDNPEYLSALELLEYDMLYGNRDVYGGVSPYEPTDMQMGVKPITVSATWGMGGSTYVIGHNFTEFSKILLNGEELDTVFVDENTLRADDTAAPVKGDTISVAQVGNNGETLSESEIFVVE